VPPSFAAVRLSYESFVGQVVGTSWADTWMPVTGKLTALKVAREKRPGFYGDGGGLYLQVTPRIVGRLRLGGRVPFLLHQAQEHAGAALGSR
jgi:hypothetical protein